MRSRVVAQAHSFKGLAAMLALATVAAGCGAAADQSGKIAAAINAQSCDQSGYEITSKLDNSKQRIYDCTMNNGSVKCVTYNSGIASDSTAIVKILFANTLSGGKPSCIA